MYWFALAGLVAGDYQVVLTMRAGLGVTAVELREPLTVARGVGITAPPSSDEKYFPSRLRPSDPDVFLPHRGLYRSSNESFPGGFGNVFRASNPLNGHNLCHP
jgi:hypothetical protein